MQILVRQIRMQGERVVDRRDLELAAGSLRLGRGQEQDLRLPGAAVAARHAVLQPRVGGQLTIRCRDRGARVDVDGKPRRRVTLAPGQQASIGPHHIAPIEAPPGFDAAIELRIDTEADETFRQRMRADLAPKLPRLRFYSYLLALLVTGLTVAVPLVGFYNDSAQQALQDNGAPTDRLWSSGPLAKAHHVPGLGDNCQACHDKPFQRVRDDACVTCHDDTTAHFTAANPAHDAFDDHCRTCHQEHNEPSTLVVLDNNLCTSCHAGERQRLVGAEPAVDGLPVAAAPERIAPATAFTREGHPQFLASLVRAADTGWVVDRERLGSPDAKESSHLKFSHHQHLDFDKVSFADGLGDTERPLACADCHQLAADGEHFRPMTMESTCRACHSLAFDDAQPDRQLPHGDPAGLRTYLEEYYVRQAALQSRAGPRDPARRVPEKPAVPRCDGDALDCGEHWADEQMDKLFTKAGCVSCHEVHRDGDADWQVEPVRLVPDWFSGARFDHRPHLNPGGSPGDEMCVGCHAAPDSTNAHDVLMPGIDTCVTCHGEDQPHAVDLQCTDCHSFHRDGMPIMAGEE